MGNALQSSLGVGNGLLNNKILSYLPGTFVNTNTLTTILTDTASETAPHYINGLAIRKNGTAYIDQVEITVGAETKNVTFGDNSGSDDFNVTPPGAGGGSMGEYFFLPLDMTVTTTYTIKIKLFASATSVMAFVGVQK